MTALEKAARAVEEVMASDDNMPADIARAVLLAVREPGDEVLTAMRQSSQQVGPLGNWLGEWQAKPVFVAAIEAILSEQSK